MCILADAVDEFKNAQWSRRLPELDAQYSWQNSTIHWRSANVQVRTCSPRAVQLCALGAYIWNAQGLAPGVQLPDPGLAFLFQCLLPQGIVLTVNQPLYKGPGILNSTSFLKNKNKIKNPKHPTAKGLVLLVRDFSQEPLKEVPISIVTHSLVFIKQSKRNTLGFVLFSSLVFFFSFVVVVAIVIVWLVWLFDIRIPVAKADLELAMLSKLAFDCLSGSLSNSQVLAL